MDLRVGLLGGGQLGKMLIQEASRMAMTVHVLDPEATSPAKQVANHACHYTGSFADSRAIAELASNVDVLTVEIEHVDAAALADIERRCATTGGRSGKGVRVRPSADVIRLIQDKYAQHVHLRDAGIPVAPFAPLDSGRLSASLEEALRRHELPLMVKSRTLAYDGRGNFVVQTYDDQAAALETLGSGQRELYIEEMVPFICEVAVMVVRAVDGQMASYPAVETLHRNNICHLVYAPLRTGPAGAARQAQALAERAVASLGSGAVGVFGVEMFLLQDGQLLINEIAPRPHNSGHYTIEACATSQYENHLRAVLDLPLGSTELVVPSAAMLNILGASDSFADLVPLQMAALRTDGASLHMYGKAASRPARKLGHVTLVGADDASIDRRMASLLAALPANQRELDATKQSSMPKARPLVGIIMGSDSDLGVMHKAGEQLQAFDVPFELQIVSAHRTPHLMVRYASEAAERGLRVIIAGAGGAAHLPGMVAALTTLPVVGVPVKGSTLDGVDSLHSIVQMPRGVPVATVAIDNATNAALLAIRILAAHDDTLARRLSEYALHMASEVEGKRERMRIDGWSSYMK